MRLKGTVPPGGTLAAFCLWPPANALTPSLTRAPLLSTHLMWRSLSGSLVLANVIGMSQGVF